MQAVNQAAGGLPLLICTDQEGGNVTRLGFGVPVGSNLEYADDATMLKALEGRREM